MSQKMDRRKFLKLAGTAAVAMSAAGLLAGCEDEPASSSRPASSSSSRPASSSSKPTSSSSQPESTLPILWKYSTNNNGGVTITGYDGNQGAIPTGNVTIPSTWAQSPVTEISGNLGGKITKLTIPGSVKCVDRMGSSNLQEVVLQNGVEELGDNAFTNSSRLTKVTLPATVKKIGWRAFDGCTSLTSVSLPASLTELGYRAFGNTGLISVTIPEKVEKMGNYVFADCKNLTKVVDNSTVVGTCMCEGCVSLSSVTLNKNTMEIGSYAFKNCKALASIALPANLQSIWDEAFFGCTKLIAVTLPSKTTQFGSGAFQESGLTSLKFAYGTTSIPRRIFQDAKAFSKVYIPITVSEISYYAFYGTNLQHVYYAGNQTNWTMIDRDGNGNEKFGIATFHYSASPNAF